MTALDLAVGRGGGGFRAQHRRLVEWWEALPFLLPTIVGAVVFVSGPVLASFAISFTSWDLLTPPNWVGARNYSDLFVSTPLFRKVFGTTVRYCLLYAVPGLILPLLVAIFMNQKTRAISVYRSIFFLPVITSTVAIALVWYWLYNPEFGLINYLLSLIGIEGPLWLSSPRTALVSIVIMSLWKDMGYTMVIYLAGLQGVPQELYEAASIDGAGRWRRHLHVTWPILTPTVFFVLIINVIDSLQVFEQMYILTQGGPAYSTLTLSYLIYLEAFKYFHMGVGCAIAYVLFSAILLLTLLQFRLQKRWVFYQ